MSSFDKDSENFKMMRDFWSIWKAIDEEKDNKTPSFWKYTSKVVEDFIKRQKDTRFAADLGVALLNHFEIYK